MSHIVSMNINADMSKLSKHNKMHKRIPFFVSLLWFLGEKYLAPNKGIWVSVGEQATKAYRILV